MAAEKGFLLKTREIARGTAQYTRGPGLEAFSCKAVVAPWPPLCSLELVAPLVDRVARQPGRVAQRSHPVTLGGESSERMTPRLSWTGVSLAKSRNPEDRRSWF